MDTIVISPPENYPYEGAIVNELFRRGLARYHLRKLVRSEADLIMFLNSIESRFHRSIVVHSPDVPLLHGRIAGFHRSAYAYSQGLIGQYVSTGFHSVSALEESFDQGELNQYEYVFLSPVFDSISKKGYKAAIPFEDAKCALERIEKPVYALGGVKPEHFSLLKHTGFAGAALLGYIWESVDPVKAFEKVIGEWSANAPLH